MNIGARNRWAAGRIVASYASGRAPKPEDISLGSNVGVRNEVVRLALGHGVAGLIPIENWLGPEHSEVLAATRREALRRHLQTLATIRVAGAAFDRAGLPWLVFKGPVLAELMYARPDHRIYFDLDLLVPRRCFEEALLALENAGGSVLDVNWTMTLDRMSAEVRLLIGETVIDLHWHLFNRRALRRRFAVDIDGSFERARSIELAGRVVATLGRVDTILHTALHAAVAGADRLAWLKDVDGCVRTEDPGWRAVVDLARRWRVELPVAGTLWRARRVLGTPVPNDVLTVLIPPAWRAVLWGAQRLAPVERTMPGRSLSRLVSRAARESGRTSALSLVQRSLDGIVQGKGTTAADDCATSSSSLLFPSGGQEARSAYLRAVTMSRPGME